MPCYGPTVALGRLRPYPIYLPFKRLRGSCALLLTVQHQTPDELRQIALNKGRTTGNRRNLQSVDRVRLAMKFEDVIKEMARKNLITRTKEGYQELGKAEPIHTSEKLAEIAGVSDETIRKYKVIQRDADEDIKEAVNKGEKSITKGFQETKRAQLKSEPTSESKVRFKTCNTCGETKPNL